MERELEKMGFSYDWDREVSTCDADYYKWNQWIFLKMYEKGLAYKKASGVNWCPSCATTLANEEVIDGGCWRCHTPVEQKELEQWYLKITEYKERLILQKLMQENIEKDPAITDEDIKKYFDSHPEEFKESEQVRARHILVKTHAAAEEQGARSDLSRFHGIGYVSLARER